MSNPNSPQANQTKRNTREKPSMGQKMFNYTKRAMLVAGRWPHDPKLQTKMVANVENYPHTHTDTHNRVRTAAVQNHNQTDPIPA